MRERLFRRIKPALVAAAAGLCLLASASSATPLAEGGVTAEEVAALLTSKGYAADVSKDSDGAPEIRSGSEGSHFYIYFYGCNKQVRCSNIEFGLAYHVDGGMEIQRINAWNRRNRFGRAYLDSTNDPYLEMDVDVEHGFTTEELANNLAIWNSAITLFRRFLLCKDKPDTQGCKLYQFEATAAAAAQRP